MPGAEELDSVRQRVLDTAAVHSDRIGALASFAQGKHTLNVGCTGYRPGSGAGEEALARHVRIAQAASECLGLDLDADGVAELERRGFPAIVADACTCSLGRTFEVIIAGEIIEHVGDGGQFLLNMRRHLGPGGLLVSSTCNPFCPKRFWKIVHYGHPCVHPEHACWYDPVTLMGLGMRCGLEPRELVWVQEPARLDPRLIPRLLRRYFSGNFVLTFAPREES